MGRFASAALTKIITLYIICSWDVSNVVEAVNAIG